MSAPGGGRCVTYMRRVRLGPGRSFGAFGTRLLPSALCFGAPSRAAAPAELVAKSTLTFCRIFHLCLLARVQAAGSTRNAGLVIYSLAERGSVLLPAELPQGAPFLGRPFPASRTLRGGRSQSGTHCAGRGSLPPAVFSTGAALMPFVLGFSRTVFSCLSDLPDARVASSA